MSMAATSMPVRRPVAAGLAGRLAVAPLFDQPAHGDGRRCSIRRRTAMERR
jgi:hypothetical protein